MKTDTPKTILLSEYTPPAYLVPSIDLEFRLDPHATRVTAVSRMERTADTPADAPLVLSGLLTRQIGEVCHAYESAFRFSEPATREDWVRLDARRRGPD